MRLVPPLALAFTLCTTAAYGQSEILPFTFATGPDSECNVFLINRPGNALRTQVVSDLKARSIPTLLAPELKRCAAALTDAAKKESDWKAPEERKNADGDVDNKDEIGREKAEHARLLIALHLGTENLRRWTKDSASESLLARGARNTVEELESRLHGKLEEAGLRQQVWAALVGGVAFPMQTSGTDHSSVALATTGLEFQTRHWENRFSDLGLGGRLGLMPVSVVKKDIAAAEPGAAAESNDPFEVQQTALVMAARLGLNVSAGATQEFTAYIEPGLTSLLKPDSVSTTEDHRVDAFHVPVENGQGRLSETFEFGFEWNLYRDAMVNIHEFKTFTTPQVRLGVGFRTDRRFQKLDDLFGFTSPERRTVFRITVDDIPVFDRRMPGEVKPAAFKIGLTLEYERAGWLRRAKGAVIPAGMRLVMQGNLGLLQILGK
jgi:hypothetical protein